MLQTLEFGCVYVYSKGTSPLSLRSNAHVGSLKRGDQATLSTCANRAATLTKEGFFPGFFGDDVTLAPIPGSAPLVTGGLWVPNLLAQALKGAGLAREVIPILRRIKAVAKSAYSVPADRPDVETHFNSLAADVLKPPPKKILLVDDVVTQGSTLLAAARRIEQAYPNAEIKAFALFRPMGRDEIEKMLEPCVGTITPRANRAMRRP